MILSLIVAASDNNAIGKDNKLLWHLPKDMKFFKSTTWAHPVIMGRKTYVSLDEKPLAGRKSIIITRQNDYRPADVWVVNDLKTAVSKAKETNSNEIFIIGGGEIFKQSMTIADRIYMTRVHTQVDGDTFFPEIDEAKWKLVNKEDIPADEKHAFAFSFEVWEKKIIN